MTIPYRLEYFGQGDTATDITSGIIDIQKFTDVGTGEVTSARVMLDSRFGDFVTESNGGKTPIISQYDVFRLTVAAGTARTHVRYLFQDDISPQKNDQGGFITLELFGQEAYLQKMYFPGHFYFIAFNDMIDRIVDFYNTNRGANQPELARDPSDLSHTPNYAFGVFEFGEKTTVYDALMEVVNRLALPTAAGGDGRRWGLTFPIGDLKDLIVMRMRPVGIDPETPITLPRPITISETKEPLKGNIVVVKGKPGSGSYPSNPSIWRSLVEEFDNIPVWDPTTPYRDGVYVTYEGVVYQSRVMQSDANQIPMSTPTMWELVTFADYVEAQTGDRDFVYSPLTHRQSTIWKNRGGNPGGAGDPNDASTFSFNANNVPSGKTAFNALCFPDHNLVIRDRNAWRDWVDCRVLSLDDIPSPYLYPPTATSTTRESRIYHGLRVLVDPELDENREVGEPFNVPDKFGNSFTNAMAMLDRDGDWIVIRNARQFDECAVMHEGATYEFNAPAGKQNRKSVRHIAASTTNLAWRNGTEYALGNDCFHYPAIIANTDGLIGESGNSRISLNKTSNTRYTDLSGIRLEYHFRETNIVDQLINNNIIVRAYGAAIELYDRVTGRFKDFTDEQLDLLHNVGLYNIGWWCPLWEAPDPKNTYHGIPQRVGEVFGGDADNKRPVLDLLNLNQTPSGLTGYGQDDSDQLFEIDGIKFLLNFDIGGVTFDRFTGDFPVRCFIYDLLGNVWAADSTYRFLGFTEEMNFPLSSFRIYRARIQPAYTIGNFISRAIDPELKITEIFERRLVKRIGFQFMFTYDDDGRYNFDTWEGFLRRALAVLSNSTVVYGGTIDALHFTKTPVAIARDTTDPVNSINQRHIMQDIIEYNQITNVRQLQKIANAELDRAKFQEDYITVKIEDFVDVHAEDQVYVKDSDIIPESESGEAGTRRMIVRKVNYSVGDKSSTSGVVATIDLYRIIPITETV